MSTEPDVVAELEAERAEHRRTAERWDEERRKWYAERERLVAQLASRPSPRSWLLVDPDWEPSVDQEPKT